MSSIIVADCFPVETIASRAAELFNPWVLVGRDRLAGKLAAEPISWVSKDYPHAVAQRCQRGGTSTYARAANGDVTSKLGSRSNGRKRK
jgi:hypothetical protein